MLSILKLIFVSLIELFYLVGVLIGIGLLLGVLEKKSNTYLQRAFGRKGILITALIGTPIHEGGHLIQILIWRHKVIRVKFLQLGDPNGVLGYVEHQYNKSSLYQQVGLFFIGLGPIFSGITSIIIAMYVCVPHSYETFKHSVETNLYSGQLDMQMIKLLGVSILDITKSLFTLSNLLSPLFWIFLVFASCVSSHIALSKADIRGSVRGLITIYLLIVVFNVIAISLDLNGYNMIISMTKYNAYILAFLSIAVLFSFITFVISFLLYKGKGN
jgi:hypothetical protein